MSETGQPRYECYTCGHTWFLQRPNPRRSASRRRVTRTWIKCTSCGSEDIGPTEDELEPVIPQYTVAASTVDFSSVPEQSKSMKFVGGALVIVGGLASLAYFVLAMLYYFGTHGVAWGIVAFFILPISLMAAPFISIVLGHGGGLLLFGILALSCLWLGYALQEVERSVKSMSGVLMLAGGIVLALFAAITLIGIPLSLFTDDELEILQAPEASQLEQYFEEAQVLNPASDAVEEWTRLIDEHNQMDATQLTLQEALLMSEAELAAATTAYIASRDALAEFRLIVPPEECQETHLIMTEALQLQEQGFGEMKAFMELALLSGTVDHAMRLRANQLLADADRVKQQGLFESASGECK